MKIGKDVKTEKLTAQCVMCLEDDAPCLVTGGGPVCIECFDESDNADWEPVDQ